MDERETQYRSFYGQWGSIATYSFVGETVTIGFGTLNEGYEIDGVPTDLGSALYDETDIIVVQMAT